MGFTLFSPLSDSNMDLFLVNTSVVLAFPAGKLDAVALIDFCSLYNSDHVFWTRRSVEC